MKNISLLFKANLLFAAFFIALPGMAAMLPELSHQAYQWPEVNAKAAAKMFTAAARRDGKEKDKVKEVKNAIEKEKVDVNLIENPDTGYTALHFAAEAGNYEVVEYLVGTAKAEVNKEDIFLSTALHYAAKGGAWEPEENAQWESARKKHYDDEQKYLAVVKYLVDPEKGNANQYIEDRELRTPLSYAVEAGYVNVATYLIETSQIDFKAPTDPEKLPLLHYAVLSGKYEMVELIICQNVDVNETTDAANGKTALMLAAQKGDIEIVKYLAKQGYINFRAVDEAGKTATQYAQENGHQEVADFLSAEEESTTN